MIRVEECAQFLRLLAAAIPAHAPNFDANQLRVWCQALCPRLEPKDVTICYNHAIVHCRAFPTIAEILEMVKGKPADEAQLVADKLARAVYAFPSINGHGDSAVKLTERIKTDLGAEGWQVVVWAGGWNHLHEQLRDDNLSYYKHEWKKTAQLIIDARNKGKPLGRIEAHAESKPTAKIAEAMRQLGESTSF